MIVKRVLSKTGAVGILVTLCDADIVKLKDHTMVQLDVSPYKLGLHSIILATGSTDEAILNEIDPKPTVPRIILPH